MPPSGWSKWSNKVKFKNSHIVLTGATGGIGQAIAKELADQGAYLTLVARDNDRLDAFADTLPGVNHTIAADLCAPEGRAHLVRKLDEIREPVDLLINNAGVSELSLYENQTEEDIEKIMQTNLLVPMLLTRAVLPRLRQSGAQILNIGSVFGSIAYPGFAAYSSSKFGLRGFSEALGRELSDSNVLVQYAAPRATRTALNSARVNALNARLGNQTDEPSVVASSICKLIKSRRKSLTIGWPEKLFVNVNSVCSTLVDRAIRSKLPVLKQTLLEDFS